MDQATKTKVYETASRISLLSLLSTMFALQCISEFNLVDDYNCKKQHIHRCMNSAAEAFKNICCTILSNLLTRNANLSLLHYIHTSDEKCLFPVIKNRKEWLSQNEKLMPTPKPVLRLEYEKCCPLRTTDAYCPQFDQVNEASR